MFTGIVEDVGIVKNITASGKSGKIRICANKVLEDVHLGDSIAVNGVCLTVCEIFQNEFVADGNSKGYQFKYINTKFKGKFGESNEFIF